MSLRTKLVTILGATLASLAKCTYSTIVSVNHLANQIRGFTKIR